MVKLISLSLPVDAEYMPDTLNTAESLMAYCARVSSPKQDNPSYAKLLTYCANNSHWSVFEMADMTVEITTSRAISQQILRHRSFSFQEFSQRYAETTNVVEYPARRQDMKNRQNSIDDLTPAVQDWFLASQQAVKQLSTKLYQEALDYGIAKECARFLLPLSTETKVYMKGSVRSFIHYCQVRCHPSTQLEHREIADQVKAILLAEFPSLKGVFDVSEL